MIISHCTWLYFRFALSYRDVEEMMAERGVTVSYESIREWCLKFGGVYTKRIRSCRGRLGDRWHLDEIFVRINGKLQYVWRAVALSRGRLRYPDTEIRFVMCRLDPSASSVMATAAASANKRRGTFGHHCGDATRRKIAGGTCDPLTPCGT